MLEYSDRGGLITKKKVYTCCLQETIESHLAFKAFLAFNMTNFYLLIRKHLESHLFSKYCQGLGNPILSQLVTKF